MPSWQTGMKTLSAKNNAPTILGTLHVCNGNAASTGNSSDNTIRHNQCRPRSARNSAELRAHARWFPAHPRISKSAPRHRAHARTFLPDAARRRFPVVRAPKVFPPMCIQVAVRSPDVSGYEVRHPVTWCKQRKAARRRRRGRVAAAVVDVTGS